MVCNENPSTCQKKFLGCGGAGFVLFAEWRYHTRYLFYMYALIRTGLVSSTIFNVLESSTLCLGTIDDFYNAKLHQHCHWYLGLYFGAFCLIDCLNSEPFRLISDIFKGILRN